MTKQAKNTKKIVLVEDDSFLAGMYNTKLGMEGFNVLFAEDGEKGLEMIKKEKPDLVILDIILPKKDGFEVLAELKADRDLQKIPVVLLTNLGRKEEVDKGLALGAIDYLIKAHFVPSEVISRINNILDDSK